MKTLSIQQPWASLICSGIKDVENRTWKPAQIPGKILIHASSKKVPKRIEDQVPVEWSLEMNNARKLGNLPEYTDMPTSAIIGYVDVTGFADDTDSLWDGVETEIKWILENAYLFDEPICDVKGKLNLFDYPLDENNLPPAHKVETKQPHIEGDELIFPISKIALDDTIERGVISVDISDTIFEIFFTDEEKPQFIPIETIRFEVDGETVHRYEVDEMGAFDYFDPATEKRITYTTLRGEDSVWNYIEILLGEKL